MHRVGQRPGSHLKRRDLSGGGKLSREPRYGVFGGTFDPPHYGHLRAAAAAAAALRLQRVWFIPAARNPLKSAKPLAPAADRLAMLRAAAAADPRFAVSDCELRRPSPSYTVDTLVDLRRREPGRAVLLLGADAWAEFGVWHRAADVLKLADVVVFARRGTAAVAPPTVLKPLEGEAAICYHDGGPNEVWTLDIDELRGATRIFLLNAPRSDISATRVREWVHAGRSLAEVTPPAVAAIIQRRRLYA